VRFDLTVTYDDGTEAKVTAGQREMAAFEAEPFGCGSIQALDAKPMTFMRYLAWSALRRNHYGQGMAGSEKFPAFEKWSKDVEEVSDGEEAPAEPDPTRRDPPAEGSSG
jgi:hypothetical protein